MKFSANLVIKLLFVFVILCSSKIGAIKLLNKRTMRYLDSNSRGTVYTHRIVHVSPYKNWRLAPVGDGFNIINIRSGLYLHATRRRPFAIAAKQSGGAEQIWIIRGNFIIHRATGFVLDSNLRGQVYIHRYNGGHWQRWLRFNN